MLDNFHDFLLSVFFCCFFLKILSGKPSGCQAVLDPVQARHFVGPDIGLKCTFDKCC